MGFRSTRICDVCGKEWNEPYNEYNGTSRLEIYLEDLPSLDICTLCTGIILGKMEEIKGSPIFKDGKIQD